MDRGRRFKCGERFVERAYVEGEKLKVQNAKGKVTVKSAKLRVKISFFDAQLIFPLLIFHCNFALCILNF